MVKIQVDEKLKPDNCKSFGFEWWKDAIYDPDAPKEANKEFLELIEKGWKLGESALKELKQNGGVGLYKPLDGVKK